jgi:hypothetical protein
MLAAASPAMLKRILPAAAVLLLMAVVGRLLQRTIRHR